MRWSGLVALLALFAIAHPASAGYITQLAPPTQDLRESPPPRPVGDPDVPPIGLDFYFLESDTGHEEAWPWPPAPTDN
jgi:hypothetical protein